MAQPRSGSSMIAGLFAAHGCWTGKCRDGNKLNKNGFFENQAIKEIVIESTGSREYPNIVIEGLRALKKKGLRTKIEAARDAQGYSDGPWLWKGSALYWPAFFEFEPNFVVCHRPSEQIFESCRASGIFGRELSDERLKEIIDIHQHQISYLVACKQAHKINTYEVSQGELRTVRKALIECIGFYDENKCREFVEPALWHYRS